MLYLVFFSKLLVWDALHIHASGEPTIFMRICRIYNADKKKAEVELTWTRWSSIAKGYCQWDRRWITFSVTAYQESSLFSNAMFRCQNIISLVPTGWSLFIAGRGVVGGRMIFFGRGGGSTWFLGEQKRGSVVIENPTGEITENFGRIKAEWGTLKFAWKMKTLGGEIAKVIKCY